MVIHRVCLGSWNLIYLDEIGMNVGSNIKISGSLFLKNQTGTQPFITSPFMTRTVQCEPENYHLTEANRTDAIVILIYINGAIIEYLE